MADQKTPAGDYEVGHGRPPKRTQFQKSRSGNPGGRPKAIRPNATDVAAILSEPIPVSMGSTLRDLSAFEIGLRKLVRAALKDRDLKAALALLKLCEDYAIIEPGGVPETGGVVVLPKSWDPDEWLEMLHRYGRPPWPGERDGLPGDLPAKSSRRRR
jgi:Family of unknown function (DUF5681)